MPTLMEYWLKCTASTGQFNDEMAISGSTFDGETFSLFVNAQDVECSRKPKKDESVPALILVTLLKTEGELALVQLPAQTLENGQVVTVGMSQLTMKTAHQKA